jgi:hypothetical protein
MSVHEVGEKIMVVRRAGEAPIECIVKFVTGVRVFYSDGCLYCRNGHMHHRLGMGGSHVAP